MCVCVCGGGMSAASLCDSVPCGPHPAQPLCYVSLNPIFLLPPPPTTLSPSVAVSVSGVGEEVLRCGLARRCGEALVAHAGQPVDQVGRGSCVHSAVSYVLRTQLVMCAHTVSHVCTAQLVLCAQGSPWTRWGVGLGTAGHYRV